jgi:hypothetical protein
VARLEAAAERPAATAVMPQIGGEIAARVAAALARIDRALAAED